MATKNITSKNGTRKNNGFIQLRVTLGVLKVVLIKEDRKKLKRIERKIIKVLKEEKFEVQSG